MILCCVLHLQFERVCAKDDHDVFGLKDGFGAWHQKWRSPIGNTNEAAENCSKNILLLPISFEKKIARIFILALVKIISQKKNSFSTYLFVRDFYTLHFPNP